MTLRWYQQEAFDAAVAWMRRCVDPAVIELPTGSGKSHVVSAIAEWSHHESGKKVLCLAPSKELTEQNFEKYQSTGNPASYYSASLGRSMAHPVVYGTPQTVINDIRYFRDQFGVVVVDECHETTPTIRKIISSIREQNPRLRVIGLTATPYTMQQGYIYTHDEDGNPTQSEDAYYKRLIYRLTARTLIDEGFLTPPNLDPTTESYDTSALEVARTGLFTSASIERAFEGKGRLTADIVADVVRHAQDRMGVMIFAATVQHAKEIMESLPPQLSRMIGGDVNMGKAERETLVRDFKAQRFKYLVSVGTLTRGFDATHVDVVAILRATESPGLLQQIIGRGLRLHEGKADCLVLDHAGNIERHGLHDDLFTPEVRIPKRSEKGEPLAVACQQCGTVNQFTARPNPDGFALSDDGYFLDLDGNYIETTSGAIPSHYGRRCFGQIIVGGHVERCAYRWSSKECPSCAHHNDIAARYCEKCSEEIIDPNEKLQLEFQRMKSDPQALTTDAVRSWKVQQWTSNAGNATVRIDYVTDYARFPIWYSPRINKSLWADLCSAVFGKMCPSVELFVEHHQKGRMPETITAVKPKGSRYYRAYAHNRPEDKLPS